MLHLFIILQTTAAVFANPFLKYPYVFLLDVGNEEIGKFNTEQIRLSIPGGSLAVRYPAVGDGDTIGHVRVSGIDFGTDLKANIIQGGPGYKYAVFVFTGKPGTPYDAVVTIQTVPNVDVSPSPKFEISNKENIEHGLEDANDSSEDTSDNGPRKKSVYRGNTKQVMQSSSNVYQYTSKDAVSDDDLKYEVELHSEDDFNNEETEDDEDDDEVVNDYKSGDKSHAKGDYSDEDSDDIRVVDVKRNQYGIYEAFKPHWFGGIRFYPQAALYTQDSYGKPLSDEEKSDDEISESNYKDLNNNINDYGSPIEYKK